MTSIRIAIATALVLTGVLAGGTAHAKHSITPASARPVALAGAPMSTSPVLCC